MTMPTHISYKLQLDHRYLSLPPAVRWGIDYEERGRQDNIKSMREVSDVTVSLHGLTLLPEYPYIGASSDEIVIDKSSQWAVKKVS